MSERRLRTEPLARLATFLRENRRVVIVTGAGLSAASGVPVFRGDSLNAIWVQRATNLGTKAAFLRDPLGWYNDFWLPLFKHEFTRCRPNAAHEAIARLANLCRNLMVVTQNIDSLHQQTQEAWDTAAQLVEVHGRLGLYHCSSEEGDCNLATETYATAAEVFPPEVAHAIEQVCEGVRIDEVPRCPECEKHPLMPLALFFDEPYESHAMYQFDKAMASFESAEALVFVGTSFQVNITNFALDEARRRSIPVWNLNLNLKLNGAGKRFAVFNSMGPAEEKLQELLALVEAGRAVPSSTALSAQPSSSTPSKRPREEERQQDDDDGMPPAAVAAAAAPVDMDGQDPPPSPAPSPAPAPIERSPSRPVPPPAAAPAMPLTYTLLPMPPLAQPLARDRVVASFDSGRFDARPPPTAEMQAAMDATWEALLARAAATGGTLFNASKFRLAGVRCDDGGNLRLGLGLTDYRAFKCTNADGAMAQRLQEEGRRHHGGDGGAYLSNKLGVSAVVTTADGHVVLIRRSRRGVAECMGMLDTPGGHAEPANVAGLASEEGAAGGQQQQQQQQQETSSSSSSLEAAIVQEIFESAAQEVVDEVGIPRAKLTDVLLMGVVRQHDSAGCPSCAFAIPCACTTEEVRACYRAGPKEKDESTELLLVRREELAAFVAASRASLTSAAQGALALFERYYGGWTTTAAAAMS